MAKYSVGDWTKNTYGDLGSFGRVTKVGSIDNCYVYDLTFVLPSKVACSIKDIFIKPRYFADISYVAECDIIPVTDPRDILLCRAMELQEEYQEILNKTEKLKMDLEALSRARELL